MIKRHSAAVALAIGGVLAGYWFSDLGWNFQGALGGGGVLALMVACFVAFGFVGFLLDEFRTGNDHDKLPGLHHDN